LACSGPTFVLQEDGPGLLEAFHTGGLHGLPHHGTFQKDTAVRQGVGANSAKAMITIIMVLLHFLIRKDQAMLLSPGNDLVYETALGSYGTRAMSLEFLVAVEQLQLVTAFMLKASMLIMYAQMTNLSRLQLVVKTTTIYVAVGFIIIEVLWLGI
jgi:hypothetical protein